MGTDFTSILDLLTDAQSAEKEKPTDYMRPPVFIF